MPRKFTRKSKTETTEKTKTHPKPKVAKKPAPKAVDSKTSTPQPEAVASDISQAAPEQMPSTTETVQPTEATSPEPPQPTLVSSAPSSEASQTTAQPEEPQSAIPTLENTSPTLTTPEVSQSETPQPVVPMLETNQTTPSTSEQPQLAIPVPTLPTTDSAQPNETAQSTTPTLQPTLQSSNQMQDLTQPGENSGTIDANQKSPTGQSPEVTPTLVTSQPEKPNMENNQFGLNLIDDEPKKKSAKLFYIIGILIIIGVAGYTAYDFFGMNNNKTTPITSATPTTVTTPVPSPTTAPANLDKSKLSVKVLNGSGTAGAASAMQSVLEKAGYTVSSTGNADNYDYAQTEIHVSSDYKDYLPLLKQDLSSSYTIGTADSDYSGSGAEVIVGKE